MSDIKNWSSSAGGNTSASPNGFPEGMSPSSLNDAAREVMASIRRWFEDAEWIDLSYTPTYQTTASFTLAGDRTTAFHANRRVRCSDTSTLYGYITSSTYSTNTRISVSLDSGALSTSLSAVAVGMLSFNNDSIPEGDYLNTSLTHTFTVKQVFNGPVVLNDTVSFSSSATISGLNSDMLDGLHVKVINIGDWNMDASATIAVGHALTLGNIRNVSALIRNDDNNGYYPIDYADSNDENAGKISIDGTSVNLTRRGGGFFKSISFDSPSYNRGWITIFYTG